MIRRLNTSATFHTAPGTRVTWNDMKGIIEVDVKHILKQNTQRLVNTLKDEWPVDTGRSRDGWRRKGNQYIWWAANNVIDPDTGKDYVSLLWYGSSRQMPNGGDPIVRRAEQQLLVDLRKHKWNKRKRRYEPIITRGQDNPNIRV